MTHSTPTESQQTAVVPTGTPTVTPVPTEEPPPQIARLLLQLDDMPTGWTVAPPTADDASDDDTALCGQPDVASRVSPLEKGETDFRQSELGPYFFQGVATYKRGDAERAIEYAAELVKNCTFWADSSDGTTVTWQIQPLSFPKIGDETFAARMSTSDIPLFGVAQFDFVYFRRGSVVEALIYGAVGPAVALPSPLESLAKRAEELTHSRRSGHHVGGAQMPSPIPRSVITLLVCSGLVCLGSVGPWATVAWATKNGLDGDGLVTLLLGGAVIAIAGSGLRKWSNRRAVGALLLSLAAFAIGVYDWVDVATTEPGPLGLELEPGWGLVLTTIAAGVGSVAAFRSTPGRSSKVAVLPPSGVSTGPQVF